MENLNLELGNRLREKRLELGYSQEELAEVIGIHRTYIGTIERGEKTVTITTLHKICKALKITMSEFLKNIDKI